MTESTLAAQLVRAREQHALIEELASPDIPADAGAAYAIQHEVLRLMKAQIGAWKVGARTPSAPPSGAPIGWTLVHASPARLELASFFRVLIEMEIAFRFERALPARAEPYTPRGSARRARRRGRDALKSSTAGLRSGRTSRRSRNWPIRRTTAR